MHQERVSQEHNDHHRENSEQVAEELARPPGLEAVRYKESQAVRQARERARKIAVGETILELVT